MSIIQPYTNFLKSKIKLATSSGFEVDRNALPDTLLPHAKDIAAWACIKGCALVAARSVCWTIHSSLHRNQKRP